MNFLIEKYISPNFNTNYLIQFLKDDSFLNKNRKEIKFRITQLTIVQSLHVLNQVIIPIYSDNFSLDEMKLSKTNIKMFFEFIDFGNFPFPCVSDLNFISSHSYWEETIIKKKSKSQKEINLISEFQNKFNSELKRLVNLLISSLRLKNEYLNKDSIEYFSNAVYGTNENFKSELGKIPIIEYLIKKLEYDFIYHEKVLVFSSNENCNYNISIKKTGLLELYKLLEINEFINSEKTTQNDFINVLLNNWFSHQSIIYLQMDHYRTKLFLDEINIKYTQAEKAKNISNNKGFIKGSILSSSASKSKVLFRPEDKLELDKILINSIKKVKI